MRTQHTPSPWKWDDNILRPLGDSERIHTIINDDGCTVYRDTPVAEFNAEIEANKRLIAAAPELLRALYELCERIDIDGASPIGSTEYANALAAIARSTGAEE